MNTYLTIFGKPRYLGLMKLEDDTLATANSRWTVLKTSRGYEMGLPGGVLTDEQQEKYDYGRNTVLPDMILTLTGI